MPAVMWNYDVGANSRKHLMSETPGLYQARVALQRCVRTYQLSLKSPQQPLRNGYSGCVLDALTNEIINCRSQIYLEASNWCHEGKFLRS